MIDRQTSSLAPLCPKEAVLVVQLKKLEMTDRNRMKKKKKLSGYLGLKLYTNILRAIFSESCCSPFKGKRVF